ncbi:invasion associated locus B family protein [Methylovirgula sp. 4M-Z18]|uniref:invasion associated locus B family protein n=1 Tax=Methylovirgula sp. 4M-Z18 TaxID=2293567 RepID=UPI000E2F4A22|nr:invasion associated locus B family protein [Methylovirgula sp. 4M-Z18]
MRVSRIQPQTGTWPAGFWRLLAGAVLALAILGTGQALAQSQGVLKNKFGDWEMRCDTPPGAVQEQCGLVQSIAAEDKPNVNLQIIIVKVADGKGSILRVVAPLGVFLPRGLNLNIDGANIGKTGFGRCLPNGCYAEVGIDDKLLQQLRNGQSAVFSIFDTPEEGIGIPVALSGFKDGYDSLPDVSSAPQGADPNAAGAKPPAPAPTPAPTLPPQ